MWNTVTVAVLISLFAVGMYALVHNQINVGIDNQFPVSLLSIYIVRARFFGALLL